MDTKTSLVETVNINLEDFSENFLTCSTCLLTFDQEARKAKLLPCSHSVCLFCLTRLASLSNSESDTPTLRCPLCRDVCILPHGGVAHLPAAFLINQLLDVMQKQRKDVVPSCNVHSNEQLLYCECCDLVFCEHCQTSVLNKKCTEHTVVPFSIALKRMSEIVLYRAKGRKRALETASGMVAKEISDLDANVDRIVEEINAAMQEVQSLVETRRRTLIEQVRVRRDEKRKVLKDQVEAIADEKKKMEKELETCKVDVRSIARSAKNGHEEQWDQSLTQPRENAFLRINTDPTQMLMEVEKGLEQFGKLFASSTFPGTSILEPEASMSVNVENFVVLKTFTVEGEPRKTGSDPVEATLDYEEKSQSVNVKDNEDGTYSLGFRVTEPGTYSLNVSIFGRKVKNSPLTVQILPHQLPKRQITIELKKPKKIRSDSNGLLYILDSGNERVRIVHEDGEILGDVYNDDAMGGGKATGLVLIPTEEGDDVDLGILNGDKKMLAKINKKGKTIQSCVFTAFEDPLDLCMDSRGQFIIADENKVFIFDQNLRPKMSFPVHDAEVTCVAMGLDDDILVGTLDGLYVYDLTGKKVRKITIIPTMPIEKRSSKRWGHYLIKSVEVCRLTGEIVACIVEKNTKFTMTIVTSYKGSTYYYLRNELPKLIPPTGILIDDDLARRGEYIAVNPISSSVKVYKFK